ncbi:MAG TPA: c-type cytochrome [Xanthobacteraceae bacterium]|nr:c-type cytochrome [Xanthobacteraceae bacterium]
MPRAATLSDQVQRCVACHGANGAPQDNTTPVISGQHEGYLYLQLRDYKSGARKNDVMSPIAGELERADMMALAEYFAHQPWPNLRQPGASDAAATRALRASASVGCTGCHLGEYQGAGTQPRLSGQERDYLLRTMMDFRTGKRGNNPGMSSLMAAASEEDLVAMADLLAGR